MDLWVVAAATGAGYMAKHWHNFAGKKAGSTESCALDKLQPQSDSYSSLQHMRNQNLPQHKSSQNSVGRNASFDIGEPDERLNADLASGMASTSGSYGNGLVDLAMSGDYNLLSLSSVPPLLYDMESYEGIKDQTGENKEFYDKSGETSSVRRFNQSKLLGSKRLSSYKAKPVNSLESCLQAQLYREHDKLEEYVGNSLPSSSMQMMRPLLVTDGSQIISRASTYYKAEMDSKRSMEFQWKPRPSFGKVRSRQMGSAFDRVSAKPYNSQGSPKEMLFLLLGMAIGVIYTAVANKREIDKLNELLKQSENLVQDLHDELEMKDNLTLKEIPVDEVNPSETNQVSFLDENLTTNFIEQELEVPIDADDQKAVYSEAMSNIEAELEAELERLELNMASSLDRISDFVEHDHGVFGYVIKGELRLNTINRQPSDSSDSDRDASGTSTNHIDTANYAVSPRELSLRLHEVIQSRLEARIVELETELNAHQKRLSSLEFEYTMNPQEDLSSEFESSSTQETQNFEDEGGDDSYKPLVINLSGEALNAYNEVYEEISWTPQTENHDKSTHYQDKNCRNDDFTEWEKRSMKGQESNENSESEDEDDEMSMILIKRIVAKARLCSPLVLNTLTDVFN